MPNWLWVLTVIPALGFLVFVHELGHFLTALRMGIKVEEFGFGYPPRIVTLTHWRGVPVTLNWLPLGGFVRMAGEEGNFDVEGSLATAPPWKKIPVMAAGAVMNILAAILIFGIVGMYEPLGPVTITNTEAGSPAEQADLQAQDVILAVEGQPINSTRVLQNTIKERRNQPTELDVQRTDPQSGDTTFNVTVTPNNGMIGVGIAVPNDKIQDHRYDFNPLHALTFGLEQTWLWTGRMITGIGMIIGSLVGANETQGPSGFAGPVGIARITGQVAREGGLISYLNLTALISVNLAVFNLLPIPALDGSRIVFALVEWVRRGKRVPPEKEAMVHAVGMLALLGLMLVVTFSDVRNIWLGRDAFGG